jgi:hypothetical protein
MAFAGRRRWRLDGPDFEVKCAAARLGLNFRSSTVRRLAGQAADTAICCGEYVPFTLLPPNAIFRTGAVASEFAGPGVQEAAPFSRHIGGCAFSATLREIRRCDGWNHLTQST